MGRIESYYIWFGNDVENKDRFNLYLDLYNKILKKDRVWHFFTEGNYDELRFHSKFKKRVEKFLNKDGRVTSYQGKINGWADDHETVEEYKDYFTEVFHQNSVLALNLSQEIRADITNLKLQRLLDRTVHSFFNMISLFMDNPYQEVTVMQNYLTDRAFYMGMIYQSRKEKIKDE